MKKRILSILLLCCMVLTLLPTAAFAADTGKAIQLGTDALSKNVNTATAPTVYFGQDHENNPAAWRVIGYNGNGVTSAQEDMTLLAAGNMSSVLQFGDFETNNRYASSYLKTAIDALAEKLTTEENTAVKKRTLTSGSYNGENTDCVAGEPVDNAVFWPLSTAEAFAVNEDLRIVDKEHPDWASSFWWLRSPGASDHDAATVHGNGSVVYSGNAISSWWCVRPAFNLNSSSVLFTSAAVGGKPDGGLTPISKYTGNEWKLTLKDSNRNFAVTETTVSGDPGDTVTLHYTGATAGINEYISVILADNSGAQYYGRVAQPTAENGTVEIKIPSGLAPGSYTLKVFSEQCNGDKKTDYASDFVDIDLTVGYQEQFTLTPGGTYYFDLSGAGIPGTANDALPDNTIHYVPFTYAGTVDAYKLTSEMATTEEYAQQNEYAHSLFVADYAVTHAVSWDNLNAEKLIFGKDYATGSVKYTIRVPSGGSAATDMFHYSPGTPQSNEWDRILDKNGGYIKNCSKIYSWGQDTLPYTESNRVVRGLDSPRNFAGYNTTLDFSHLVFRPVLEVLNPDTLGTDGLKAVTLDLGGGKLGGSSDNIQIIVKNGESFTAPASDGLTRPDGNTGSYFKWRGSDGKLYAPGDNVPADVDKLTAQFDDSGSHTVTVKTDGNGTASASPAKAAAGTEITLTATPDTGYHFKMWQVESPAGLVITNGRFTMPDNNVVIKAIFKDISKEQFRLAPGGTYYFDLYGAGIPGTANDALPDSTMHYVPFTYAGTVDAYKLTSEMATTEEYAQQNEYAHSLFVADYAVTHAVSWDNLNAEKLIFGKDYATGSVKYTIRVPSGGSAATDMFHYSPGTPQSNEWDRILDKNGGYIKNCSKIYSWGQDTLPYTESNRVVRGLDSPRNFAGYNTTLDFSHLVFRPVLEVLNPDTLGTDGLKAVTLDLGGGKLGGSSDNIQIIVKNGESFTAPASDGLTRPDGNTGSYFMWLGSNGKLYAPGESVPEVVTTLTAQWTVHQYTITYDLAGGTAEGNPGTYTIETGAFTLKNPTKSGYTFTGWSGTGLDGENNMTVTIPTGSTGERSYTAHWRYNGGSSGGSSSYPITVPGKTENGSVTVSPKNASAGSTVTITVKPDSGYVLETISATDRNGNDLKLTDRGNGKYTFTMPTSKVEIKVTFMEDNSVLNFFYDVPNDAYYYEAVKWAAENGITGGVGNSLFAPNQPCNRAQIVTFLWRAAGSPVVNYLMPFTDVDEGAYYAEAVRWAASTGIVTGLTETTFGTDSVCTRAQAAAMIYRCAQAQGKGFTGAWMFHLPFTDVPEWAYESVAWCYMNSVTTGVSETSFAPGNDCTRAQIVTFLWRAFSK